MWIGFVLNLEAKHDLDEELNIVRPDYDRNGQNVIQQYGLTYLGQPVNVSEYATRLADGPSTHVLQIDDYQPNLEEAVSVYHIDVSQNLNELVLHEMQGR